MKLRHVWPGGLLLAAAVSSFPAAIAASSGLSAAAGLQEAVAPASPSGFRPQNTAPTATPIKHLVVIFSENVSFDHYFATYPTATNPPGEPSFTAKSGTPAVNNLVTANFLTNNPNYTNAANGADAANPFRIDRSHAHTGDQNHGYSAEQLAYDGGNNDLFPKYTGTATVSDVGVFATKGQVMGYFDGNTVTALWNYAQHFAMSDNAFTDTYGPSTLGALNLVSGQTNGMQLIASNSTSYYVNDGQGGYTMISDVDPAYDTCSSASNQTLMRGNNIGDLLNAAGLTWGSFMGGFNLSAVNPNGTTGCARSTYSTIIGGNVQDYIAHHAWFQYYSSTANPTHARPSALAAIGYSFEQDGKTPEPANHNYDLQDFYDAVKSGSFPSVSFIKMPGDQDGHAGYSNPLDEQAGTVAIVNFLQHQPDWNSTAVIIAWDDSDGWYDHAFATTTSPSFDANADKLNGSGTCGSGTQLSGIDGKPVNGRCGPGTRIPFLVISPWAKANYVGHQRISLASVSRFIEDNWLSGQRLGGGSFDSTTGSIYDLFDFASAGDNARLFLSATTGAAAATLAHDFDGDGDGDILWRDTGGNVALWLMNGGAVSSNGIIANVPTSWSIVGQRDFNGDGKADLLWHDTGGNTVVWLMNGATVTSSTFIANVPTAWSIAGTGDFNGDGKADILWRDTTGNVAIWLMNGAAVSSSLFVANVPTNWTVGGASGKDIFWRDNSGNTALWLMNGGTVTANIYLGNVPTTWSIVGTGDFDGDGNIDILWRDNAGNIAVWLLDNTGHVSSSVFVANVPTTWSVAETGDFNGDGKSDMLWHDTTGNVAIWPMNGGTVSSNLFVSNVPTIWTIQGSGAD